MRAQNNPDLSDVVIEHSCCEVLSRMFPSCSLATHTTTSFNESATSTDLYLNRELSWLAFNQRVLFEACRVSAPVLERVKFLAIFSANIDEFYMKRIGGLKKQINANVRSLSVDGRTPDEQLDECRQLLFRLQKEKVSVYNCVLAAASSHGIRICPFVSLDTKQREDLHQKFTSDILPLLTPWVIDRSHPFPFVSNLSLNLLVTMKRRASGEQLQAHVELPIGEGLPRFIRVGWQNSFVRLEDLVSQHLELLFPEAVIVACDIFRVTRNANTDNPLPVGKSIPEHIENTLYERKFAPVVRLQTSTGMSPLQQKALAINLGMDPDQDIFESDILVRMSDLHEIASLDCPSLHDKICHPAVNERLIANESIFDSIKKNGSILLQHPYESFYASVERFVFEASQDSRVASIKMTLYRTSSETKIIQCLINAACSGKQVAVVIELAARFDEAANIEWASRLERAGVQVSYGIVGLKTHCKCILVVRREKYGICHYAHIGTGNYHAGTARVYADLGLLTSDTLLTHDIGQLFNYLTTGCHPQRNYHGILVAPLMIKKALLDKIHRERNKHSIHSPGLIRLKTNALEDPDIVKALYDAAQSGVVVELIVRDICRLRPGLQGLSENIRVVSIVGRYLEHSRVYYFRNAGDEEYYIGSADLMTRNLERRVELLVPIKDAKLTSVLSALLSQHLGDNVCAWEMQPDGSYEQCRAQRNQTKVNSQLAVPSAMGQPLTIALPDESASDQAANSNRICSG